MNAALVLRLFNALPAGAYEVTALLSLLRVEESRDVPTAAVTCERRPVLLLNPDFLAEHCASDEHLFLLVMHELHHVLLGHTRLFTRPTRAHNVAFDAVINSLLCARFPSPAHTSFFLRIYGGETGALRLLAPPDGAPIADPELRHLHELLYASSGDVTALEVYERLVAALGAEAAGAAGAKRLLGSHGDESKDDDDAEDAWGTAGPLDPDVVAAIRRIVEKWPPPPDAQRGRSLSDLLEEKTIAPATPGERVLAALRRALDDSAVAGPRGVVRRPGPVPAVVPIPTPRDRRAAVARLAGRPPLLFAGEASSPRARASGRARVYLDVSGSMEPFLPYLRAALCRLAARVEPRVAVFSTRVATVPVADLARGKVPSTGGTDVACVLEHALASRSTRVLVVTDGYVGAPPPALAARAKKSRLDLRVLLTPDGWTRDLAPLATRFVTLPHLSATDAPTRRTA